MDRQLLFNHAMNMIQAIYDDGDYRISVDTNHELYVENYGNTPVGVQAEIFYDLTAFDPDIDVAIGNSYIYIFDRTKPAEERLIL